MRPGFCSECGSPKSNNERICANCEFDSGSTEFEANSKSGTSKRTKVIVGIVAGLLIVFFSAHSYIKSMISPDEQITAIYKALHKGDAKQLIEAIEMTDDVIYDPQAYMDSLQYEDPVSLKEEITAAVERTETTGLPQIISSDHIGDYLKVGHEKFLGVYKRIHITALDYEVKLETDLPRGEIAIGKRKWKFEGKPISLGCFLPGTYVAVLSNESIGEGSKEKEILVHSNNRDNVYTFNKEDYMISFDGENAAGFLLINGKQTFERANELQEVGPFFTRELIELSLVQEIDGKSQYSDIVKAYPGEKLNSLSFRSELKKSK